jgi:predicted Zn-dependent protease
MRAGRALLASFRQFHIDRAGLSQRHLVAAILNDLLVRCAMAGCYARAATILATAAATLSIACATNPVTGERQLALFSEAQEIEMGRAAAKEVTTSIGLVSDAGLQAYVERVGSTLARTSHRPKLPWTFGVIDDPAPNAFALPGGFVYLTRGMMNLMNSEAELASVLGHEIGHVTARHSVSAISQQQLAQLGLGLGGIFFPATQPFGDVLGAGLSLLFLKHGRDAERQADRLGFDYALAHAYAVSEMPDVFQSLQRAGDDRRSALPSWLSTHPAPAERIDVVQQWVAALPAAQRGSRVGMDDYLRQLDGLVYGHDPRHGFFRDGVFYHPALRFQFGIPSEWSGQNLTDAVIAVSPRRDAAVQLTLSASVDPGQAADQFLAPGNIQPLRSSRQSLNGLNAVVTLFDARSSQGLVRGLVAHVSLAGRTYQLLGYTPQSRFGGYGPVFERVIDSLAPVHDSSVLNVQPQRVDIVRLDQRMTVAEFARRHDSAIPASELALINQAASPDAILPAGVLVKRITS